MQRGICRMELGDDAQAIGDFGTCVGLWPEHAWGYYNRGCVFNRDGMKAEALQDFSAALDRDPTFAAALVNRGLVHQDMKAYSSALDDFEKALAIGKGTASLHAGRGMALEALGRHAEAEAAFRDAFGLAPAGDPAHLRLRWTYGFAISSRLPDAARAAFDDVLQNDPRHPQSLYGRAMLAMERGENDEALRFLDRAIEASPAFVQARCYRAVLHARRGAWEPASRDMNWCLERDPRSGESLYAAACVSALAAAASPSARALDQAFDLLERALALGAGTKAGEDPDLIALKSDPRFARLTTATSRPQAAVSEMLPSSTTYDPRGL
jgi:eukaryotic-like serine/threonine-protein kinase